MSAPHPRHLAPQADPPKPATRSPRLWVAPVLVSLIVLAALAGLYLGGVLTPEENLRHFPIAVVNEDSGPSGQQLIAAMAAGMDVNKFDLRVVSPQEAERQLNTAKVYGRLSIPRDFSQTLAGVAASAMQPGQTTRPVITISTNPRAGIQGATIAGQALGQAMSVANSKIGERVSTQMSQHMNLAELPSAVALVAAAPIDVHTDTFSPLAAGTGDGLSAFYYALLLLLAGFTGSIIISNLVDSMLGYVPAEIGPVYRIAEQPYISRLGTLLIKWALMAALATATSAVYVAIATGLGMPVPNGWILWLYGTFAIAAVGVTSLALISALGSMGLLVNLLIFVIFGLPSAGATIPLQAAPAFYGWLASFEPMHQVFLGVRALLYFDGRADAGLAHAMWMTALGLVIGLLVGAIVTRIYDQKSLDRVPGVAAKPARVPS